jgi:hypothetical protein
MTMGRHEHLNQHWSTEVHAEDRRLSKRQLAQPFHNEAASQDDLRISIRKTHQSNQRLRNLSMARGVQHGRTHLGQSTTTTRIVPPPRSCVLLFRCFRRVVVSSRRENLPITYARHMTPASFFDDLLGRFHLQLTVTRSTYLTRIFPQLEQLADNSTRLSTTVGTATPHGVPVVTVDRTDLA